MAFGQKWVKILIILLFRLKFDDVTVTLSLIVLSLIFFHKITSVLSYSMLKFVKIECHLHGWKNRSTFQNPYRLAFWLIFDDVNCDVVFNCIVMNFFANLPWYYLIPYQNLLRLNIIFMVRKIGKKAHGGGCHTPAPSLYLIVRPRR